MPVPDFSQQQVSLSLFSSLLYRTILSTSLYIEQVPTTIQPVFTTTEFQIPTTPFQPMTALSIPTSSPLSEILPTLDVSVPLSDAFPYPSPSTTIPLRASISIVFDATSSTPSTDLSYFTPRLTTQEHVQQSVLATVTSSQHSSTLSPAFLSTVTPMIHNTTAVLTHSQQQTFPITPTPSSHQFVLPSPDKRHLVVVRLVVPQADYEDLLEVQSNRRAQLEIALASAYRQAILQFVRRSHQTNATLSKVYQYTDSCYVAI